MAQFYKAETKAFKPTVVVNAFERVGLYPWNPETIKKNCMDICPPPAEQVSRESVKAAVVAIKECEQEKVRQCCEMVEELKPVQVEFVQKAKKPLRSEKVYVRTTVEGGKESCQPESQEDEDTPSPPPKKKQKRRSLSGIKCCV